MAAVGMFFGVVQYLAGWKYLGEAGMYPVKPESPESYIVQRRQLTLGLVVVGVVLGLLAGGALTGIVTAEGIANGLGVLLLLTTVVFFIWLFTVARWTKEERKRLLVVLVLFLAASVFWSVFEQAGSTLNLFADRDTRTVVLGYDFPASWFQSLNSLFLILLAPVFAWIWIKLGKKDPTSPTKFSLGLIFGAGGFAILVFAAQQAERGVMVSPLWLTATYLLHTIGELCLSPVGLSAMTKLAPARIAGLTMGVWFLATSVGNYLGGRMGGLYESFSLPGLFGAVALYALGAAVVLALLIRPIRRMLER
jgi:POT family proton-dependent oligopeptide transporter